MCSREVVGELIKYFGEKNWTENYFLSYKLFCGSSPINHVIMWHNIDRPTQLLKKKIFITIVYRWPSKYLCTMIY